MQAAMTEMLANYDSGTDTSEESMEDGNGQGSEQDSGESEMEEGTGSSEEGRTDEENNLRHKTAKGKTMEKGKATLILKKPLKRKQPRSKGSKAADERRAKRPKRGLRALVVPASEERDSLYGSDDGKPRGRLNVRPEEDIPSVYSESSHTISGNEGSPALCDSPIPFPHSALQEEAAARRNKLNTAPPPASLAANTRSRPKTAPAETNVFNPPRLTIKLRNLRALLAKAPVEDKDTKQPGLIIKLKANPIMALQRGKSAVGFDQIQQQAIQGNIQTEGAVGSDGESEDLEHNRSEANEDSDVVKIKPRRIPTHKDNHNVAFAMASSGEPGGHPRFTDLREAEIGELQARWRLSAIYRGNSGHYLSHMMGCSCGSCARWHLLSASGKNSVSCGMREGSGESLRRFACEHVN